MNIIMISAAAVCISVFAMCIKEIKPEIGHLITIGASIVFLLIIIPSVSDAVKSISEFAAYSKAGGNYLTPIFKVTGIAYITQLGSELCLDANEKALASRVEMAGKIAICLLTIPIAKEAFIRIIGIID